MKPGIIVHLRVNPQDCMSVVDVLDKLEIDKTNLSFAQATKLALSSALESFRQQGLIPTRSGFEYTEMMLPFTRDTLASRGRKLQVAELLGRPEVQVRPLVPADPDRDRRKRRFEELVVRKNADPINFTTDEQQELVPLLEEFYNE